MTRRHSAFFCFLGNAHVCIPECCIQYLGTFLSVHLFYRALAFFWCNDKHPVHIFSNILIIITVPWCRSGPLPKSCLAGVLTNGATLTLTTIKNVSPICICRYMYFWTLILGGNKNLNRKLKFGNKGVWDQAITCQVGVHWVWAHNLTMHALGILFNHSYGLSYLTKLVMVFFFIFIFTFHIHIHFRGGFLFHIHWFS